jgi:hypothetical protein
LADAHPYNFYRILEEVNERGLGALANPSEFVDGSIGSHRSM